MEYRIERDSMGAVKVPKEAYYGAQTQRSRENFPIGVREERMPAPIIRALAYLKGACAEANALLLPERMTEEKKNAILAATEAIVRGELSEEFPLVVWQTGSGTQTNMNVNEVVSGYAQRHLGIRLHPNDDVNMSQSSNDTFPSAMHIAAVLALKEEVIPAAERLALALKALEQENEGLVKCGRTHLQDATPIRFSDEISAWRHGVERDASALRASLCALSELAIGGTAVGTGLNAPPAFGERVAKILSERLSYTFTAAENKFYALSGKNAMVLAHGALKALAADLLKIANDIRWLASGPRLGLGEIFIPENEPGSSIMPGKVNPTQCEAITMIAAQVIGNDVTVGVAAASGNFELNVFMPVMAYNFLQSARLLSEGMDSFRERCVEGIRPNREKMKENLSRSLMLVTALTPYVGYESAARIARYAHSEGISLKEAAVALGILDAEQFDEYFHPEDMA